MPCHSIMKIVSFEHSCSFECNLLLTGAVIYSLMVTVEEVACKMPENVRCLEGGMSQSQQPLACGPSLTCFQPWPQKNQSYKVRPVPMERHSEIWQEGHQSQKLHEFYPKNKKANLSIAFASVAWTRMARLRQHTKSKLSRATQLVSSLKAVLLWSSDKEIKRLFKCKCLIEPRESDTSLKCYRSPSSSLCS